MFKIFSILAVGLIFAGTASAASLEQRIIGGQEVDTAKHPYLVSIRYRPNKDSAYWHQCAGAIYSERVVITSAQCIVDIGTDERVMVVADAKSRRGADGMQYPVSNWIAHPSYTFQPDIDYDVGILILDDSFDFNHFAIHSISIAETRPHAGKLATVSGWGYREEFGPSSDSLEETQVPIVSQTDCIGVYGAGEVTDRMICAGYLATGGKDACQGDTGGPLVFDGQLVGLVSWGRGCGRPGYPGVYTFVGSLKQWIDDTAAANV